MRRYLAFVRKRTIRAMVSAEFVRGLPGQAQCVGGGDMVSGTTNSPTLIVFERVRLSEWQRCRMEAREPSCHHASATPQQGNLPVTHHPHHTAAREPSCHPPPVECAGSERRAPSGAQEHRGDGGTPFEMDGSPDPDPPAPHGVGERDAGPVCEPGCARGVQDVDVRSRADAEHAYRAFARLPA